MSVEIREQVAYLSGQCGQEEADPLLDSLLDEEATAVHLGGCTHLHASVVQVLLACRPSIVAVPVDEGLERWLIPSLVDAGATHQAAQASPNQPTTS